MDHRIRLANHGTTRLADPAAWEWADQAACTTANPDLFFGPDEEPKDARRAREKAAARICAGCPARAACLELALTRPEPHGVWGGASENARRHRRHTRLQNGTLTRPKPLGRRRKTTRTTPPRTPQVDVTGTRRRLQALAVLGYGPVIIARHLNDTISPHQLVRLRQREHGTAPAHVADQLARLYPQLTQPLTSPDATRVTRAATQRGWDGPPAWAGLDIDNPATRPHTAAAAA
ncbi:WhiB family transcriptional regulator [Nocardiopsis tropica]|uniref:Transcriptional regulator WhiB n=1 Tax=Nocardiopsis tropica TaxID=109330 RepID=A0ABU7KZN2_9ACTN|nr:WhiB family transcriptional regulator [Nocardiopsis umidischolae]MEE2054766.1 WhiB family transcriptional regulator [Nocardiopsis umidischolae]